MGSIELKMAILTGIVGGVIMVLAEAVALHRKISRFRAHLQELVLGRRFIRLAAEITSVIIVVLAQPVIVTMLVLSALDKFDPQFSSNAKAQFEQGIQHGTLQDNRRLRADPD